MRDKREEEREREKVHPSKMGLEGRLSTLQEKVDLLLELVKEQETTGHQQPKIPTTEESNPLDDHFSQPIERASAEVRSIELWKSVVAECLGTLCYIFFVCGVSIPWTGHFPPFLSIAFASALSYGTLTHQVFPESHLNPAFTLALAAIKSISPLRSVLYIIAQAGGAIAGAALLFGLTVVGYTGNLGSTTIASHVTPLAALGMEFVLSFVITLTFLAEKSRNRIPTAAVTLASTLVALPCTGSGTGNPIRSFAPAFVIKKWPHHWVFWIGPVGGAVLAAYLHKYILRRGPTNQKEGVPQSTISDGDSLDLPTAVIPTTATHDRLVERFEPLYGGTRSLYMKPSPVLPRTNLSRSQSVYASKRLEYNQPKFETLRKQLTPHSTGAHQSHSHHHHPCNDSNYESLYERKSNGGTQNGGGNLLISGPPSYESGCYKTYDTPSEKGQPSRHGNHNKRESSDLRDNQTNRILAQYETSKGLVDVDPKAAMKSQSNKSSIFYESEYSITKEKLEKKLIDTNDSPSSEHPPAPPRFRMQMQMPYQQRYQPQGQCSSERSNDLMHHGHGTHGKDLSAFPKKPYELLDNPTRKLLDFSPNLSQPNSCQPTPNSNHNSNYNARLLTAEKDSTYSRIFEPLMNSKPLPSGESMNGNCSIMSPNDQYMYSYH